MDGVSDAVLAGLIAFGVTAALTPLVGLLARAVGAVDKPRGRGLAAGGVPLLGGLAMVGGVVVAALLALAPFSSEIAAVLEASLVIVLVGALDDRFDLLPGVKLAGQIAAAVIAVRGGVVVENITLPFIGAVLFPAGVGSVLTGFGLVALMNIVNFSDGIDGLAAGVGAIAAVAFAVVAFHFGKGEAGTLSLIIAGCALGFLIFNFPPASIYMGDTGAMLLGLLLGCAAVLGSLKTTSVLALALPFLVLAVPFMDTTFVVLKRLKYRQPVYSADQEHFHHRFDRIGFSARRTVLVLYAWTFTMALLATAPSFLPIHDAAHRLRPGWTALLLALVLLTLVASAWVIYMLEILKLERSDGRLRVRFGGPPVVHGAPSAAAGEHLTDGVPAHPGSVDDGAAVVTTDAAGSASNADQVVGGPGAA